MSRRFVAYITVASFAALPFAPDEARANIDDPPASALGQLFSGSVYSSSAAATASLMTNTIEGEDFPVERYELRKPAANVFVTIPTTAPNCISSSSGMGQLTLIRL